MTDAVHLPDVNVLVALHEGGHPQHQAARRWFDQLQGAYATCLLTQVGFVRIMSNPKIGGHRMDEAMGALALLTAPSRHTFWPITDGWEALSKPFTDRLFGHQQITDACLLGLAVRENGVLVTMDKGIDHMAGAKYTKNLLLLRW